MIIETRPAAIPSPTSTAWRPAVGSDRHELIDVVRGFALFGVLLSNLTSNAYLGLTRSSMRALPLGDLERTAATAMSYLVRGKFLFLFALLFGIGLALQIERGRGRARPLSPVYLRRLAVLAAIGFAHLLLWYGDILHMYALAGFALFALRRRSTRFLIIAGGTLAYVTTTLFLCLPAIQAVLGQPTVFDPAARAAQVASLVAVLSEGGLLDIVEQSLRVYWHRFPPATNLLHAADALGLFMLGLALGRQRWLQQPHRYRGRWRRLLVWGLAIGLPTGLCYAFLRRVGLDSPWHVPIRLPAAVGVIAMGAAYLAALALLWTRARPRRLLRWLAPVGRMALTNYLSHSVCFLLLFTGLGLGLVGRIGPIACLPIALAIFGAQIPLSRWWLGRFRFGPAEWLWRSLTYARRQPFRRPDLASRTPIEPREGAPSVSATR